MKKLYIYTMGCQMNVYDTEQIGDILHPVGYERTSSLDRADLIIANTCAIRQKAEQKAFSFLGRTAELKQKNPGLIVGIGGCVAQQEGENIFRRLPYVDLIFGTDAISRLPAMIARIEETGCRMIDVELEGRSLEIGEKAPPPSVLEMSKFVTIMRGCDNFCTYCVVPHVRGRERSRHPDDIINEIRRLAESGVLEVTLLGQNVNSYGMKEGLCSFAELLEKINRIEALQRIRFTTSHPKDLSDELIRAFCTVEKLCDHIHLPVQSGSDAVLKKMNRKYTTREYLDKVGRLRDACPGIAVTSDIIVGFPGESENDFSNTLDLIKTVEYDSLFVFLYSDRPNAPAAAFSGKVHIAEKNRRFQSVMALQERITAEKNGRLVGSTVEVLVEGQSKKQRLHASEREPVPEWSGRTSTNKVVNFISDDPPTGTGKDMTGRRVHVYIEKALAHSLWGKMIDAQPTHSGLKGEKHYVA